jgi:hypothetical protein
MVLVLKDRVKEVVTTTGTGDFSLGVAEATFETFDQHMSNGDTTYYAIAHTATGVDEWEVGVGTWNTGNTLTRTTVIESSNNDALVDFSEGNKNIFMTVPSSRMAYKLNDGSLEGTDTDDVAEGSTNLYYTDARVLAALPQDIDTTDDVTFNSVTATTVDINGGGIDGTTIGGTTPDAATVTTQLLCRC